MAKSTPWGERSGSERRQTFGRFGLLYGFIAVVTLALGWIPIGIIFALGALGLLIARFTTTTTPAEPERPKPAWMLAMDDPDAPDQSLAKYRTEPHPGDTNGEPSSSFDRPGDTTGTDAVTDPSEDFRFGEAR